MNGFTLLLAVAAMGVDYGWQPSADGQLEYIVQIEPISLVAMSEGQEVVSEIDSYVKHVRRFRVRVGTDLVPRRGEPPRQSAPNPEADKLLDNFNGVTFGWQPISQTQMEYIIQIEPTKLAALRNGEQIVGELASQAVNVSRFRIRVGKDKLPRTPLPKAPAVAEASSTPPSLNSADVGQTESSRRAGSQWQPATATGTAAANNRNDGQSVDAIGDGAANAKASDSQSGGSTQSALAGAMDRIRDEWQAAEPQWPSVTNAEINEMLQWSRANPPPWPSQVAATSEPAAADPWQTWRGDNSNSVATQWSTNPHNTQWSGGNPTNSNASSNHFAPNYTAQNNPVGNPVGNDPRGSSFTNAPGYDPRSGGYQSVQNNGNYTDPRNNGGYTDPRNNGGYAAGVNGGYGSAAAAGQHPTASSNWNRDVTQQFDANRFAANPNQPGYGPTRVVSYDAAVPGGANGAPIDPAAAGQVNPPTLGGAPGDPHAPQSEPADADDKPWAPLFWAVMALFASMGGNMWMGWIAIDLYRRFQDLLNEAPGEFRRRESRSRRDEDDDRPQRSDRFDD